MEKIKNLSNKLYEIVKKCLVYLRINDEHNRLSLTNITMLIILFKLYTTPSTTFGDITTLAIAVLGYQQKRKLEK